jgi:hypothetical protein
MTEFQSPYSADLTTCFRFGQEVADIATDVIRTIGATNPLIGNSGMNSTVGPVSAPNCIVSRTNLAIFEQLVLRQGMIEKCSIGDKQRRALLEQLMDVALLKQGKRGHSPELRGYRDWEDLERHAGSGRNQQLKSFHRLIERFGDAYLSDLVSRTSKKENEAQITLTTAHRSKGQEWNRVIVHSDFEDRFEQAANSGSSPFRRKINLKEETRLLYVAITRGREQVQIPPKLLRRFASGFQESSVREESIDIAGKTNLSANPSPMLRKSETVRPRSSSIELHRQHVVSRNGARLAGTKPSSSLISPEISRLVEASRARESAIVSASLRNPVAVEQPEPEGVALKRGNEVLHPRYGRGTILQDYDPNGPDAAEQKQKGIKVQFGPVVSVLRGDRACGLRRFPKVPPF